jgi:hypothetical protein
MEKPKLASAGGGTKEAKAEMLKTESLCALAAWREKFMGPLRVPMKANEG